MKIVFKKEELLKYMTPAMSSVSEKNTLASIGGILFTANRESECTISSFDLEKGFRAVVKADVQRQGSYIIPAMRLYRIVRIMPEEEIIIEVNEKSVVSIRSGKSEFRLTALLGTEFPSLPELEGEKGFSVKCNEFRSLVEKVQHAIAISEQQRIVLLGAYFIINGNNIKIVACDGNRLAIRYKNCEISENSLNGEYGFIVPGKTLGELLRLIPDSDDKMKLAFGRKHVIFKIDNMIFFSRLIDGEYINYHRIIPSGSTIFAKVNKDELLTGLERVSLVADDKSVGQTRSFVKCDFTDDTLYISSQSSAYAVRDEMDIRKDGEDISIGFSCKYLCDALRAIDDETVTMEMLRASSPVTMQGESDGEGYMYVICPVKMV